VERRVETSSPATRAGDQVQRLLDRLEAAWAALTDSYAGAPESKLVEPGLVDDWSVKDVLAHVTTWDQEALRHLPLIIAGGTPPRYAAQGGIDAFNARRGADTGAAPPFCRAPGCAASAVGAARCPAWTAGRGPCPHRNRRQRSPRPR
jgi:hypothetical protein